MGGESCFEMLELMTTRGEAILKCCSSKFVAMLKCFGTCATPFPFGGAIRSLDRRFMQVNAVPPSPISVPQEPANEMAANIKVIAARRYPRPLDGFFASIHTSHSA